MFSLQTIFGKGDKFYGLLEASAEAAHESAKALRQMLENRERAPVMAEAPESDGTFFKVPQVIGR